MRCKLGARRQALTALVQPGRCSMQAADCPPCLTRCPARSQFQPERSLPPLQLGNIQTACCTGLTCNALPLPHLQSEEPTSSALRGSVAKAGNVQTASTDALAVTKQQQSAWQRQYEDMRDKVGGCSSWPCVLRMRLGVQ